MDDGINIIRVDGERIVATLKALIDVVAKELSRSHLSPVCCRKRILVEKFVEKFLSLRKFTLRDCISAL